jgi:hypothetical protein
MVSDPELLKTKVERQTRALAKDARSTGPLSRLVDLFQQTVDVATNAPDAEAWLAELSKYMFFTGLASNRPDVVLSLTELIETIVARTGCGHARRHAVAYVISLLETEQHRPTIL